jgi:small lipoprotein (TIGR04454 family)
MKKILVIAMLLLASILFSNCKGEVVSAAECAPIVDQMFVNLLKELKPEEAEKAKSMEAAIKPGVIKECTSGKFNLDCLKSATNIAALQTCKK